MTPRMKTGTWERIFDRESGVCLRCGGAGSEVHHRRSRGMGGTAKDPHGVANLVLLCAACHRWVESHRAAAYEQGWLIRRSNPTPADQIPVQTGRGLVWLTNNGEKD